MKRHQLVAISIVIAFVTTVACTKKSANRKQLDQLQTTFHHYLTETFTAMEQQHKRAVDKLKEEFSRLDNQCPSSNQKNAMKSTLYIPKSAKHNSDLHCFSKASFGLEEIWSKDNPKTTSWQYVFDKQSKGFRIFPAQNATSIYGEDLDFSKFNFVTIAQKNFPNLAWSGVHMDVAGTGKIIMITQEVELAAERLPVVVGADMRVSQIMQVYSDKLLAFAKKASSKHAFIYAYHHKDGKRVGIFNSSSNPRAWETIRPLADDVLRIESDQLTKIYALEKSSFAALGKVMNAKVEMKGRTFYCNMSTIKSAPIHTLACDQE